MPRIVDVDQRRAELAEARGDSRAARDLWDEAIERDPGHVGAYSLLAYVNVIEAINGWGQRPPDELMAAATDAA